MDAGLGARRLKGSMGNCVACRVCKGVPLGRDLRLFQRVFIVKIKKEEFDE